jgi:hypothetical protein
MTLAGAMLVLALMPASADAAKSCGRASVEGGIRARVATIQIDCAAGWEVSREYYRRTLAGEEPDGYSPSAFYRVAGFRCYTGLAGSQMFCHSGDRHVFASTRPEDFPARWPSPTKPAPRRSAWKSCGQSEGSFPVYGFPPIRAAVKRINARFVRCGKAKRFAHKLYFKQECVLCDSPTTYRVGDKIRFRGFVCRVSGSRRRGPSKFSCRRDRRIINFRAVVYV